MAEGGILVCPPSLDAVTTYVLLEQEAWFEKEWQFLDAWLQPGMTAIDIGANLGVYAIAMARRVGAAGRVFAYEPGSVARGFLEESVHANGLANLHILPQALSDRARNGHLTIGHSTELNALSEGDGGEPVAITALDIEDGARGWGSPDFVKLDAEGEELRIVEGGRSFFTRHDPLVMFEVRQGEKVNTPLIAAFRALGYGIYRALPWHPVLLPFAEGEEIDGYELNLFAAKPSRASLLARRRVLLASLPAWTPDNAARDAVAGFLSAQPYAARFGTLFRQPLDPAYRDGLSGYVTWRAEELPLEIRCAALRYALESLLALCGNTGSIARIVTLARIAWEAGRRSVTVVALQAFGQLLRNGLRLDAPFLSPTPRFDAVAPGLSPQDWFLASGFELYERSKNLSSFWGASGVDLDWLTRQPFADIEMERRRLLLALRTGRHLPVPARLRTPAPDHLNAELWRAGLVPNSFV